MLLGSARNHAKALRGSGAGPRCACRRQGFLGFLGGPAAGAAPRARCAEVAGGMTPGGAPPPSPRGRFLGQRAVPV